jgi:hypothetical protein
MGRIGNPRNRDAGGQDGGDEAAQRTNYEHDADELCALTAAIAFFAKT